MRWRGRGALRGSERCGRWGLSAEGCVWRCVYARGPDLTAGGGAHSCVCVCGMPPPWYVGLENSLSLGFRLAWVHSPLSDFPVV